MKRADGQMPETVLVTMNATLWDEIQQHRRRAVKAGFKEPSPPEALRQLAAYGADAVRRKLTRP